MDREFNARAESADETPATNTPANENAANQGEVLLTYPADTITILKPVAPVWHIPNGRKSYILTENGWALIGGGEDDDEEKKLCWGWAAQEIVPRDLIHAGELLAAAGDDISIFVHGRVSPITPKPHCMHRRKCEPNEENHKEKRFCVNAPSYWALLDLDKAPKYPGDVSGWTFKDVADWNCAGLGQEFRDADKMVHVSSSFGTEPGRTRCHVLVRLNEPLDERGRQQLLADAIFTASTGQGYLDAATLRTVQPVWLAPPEFRAPGQIEPLPDILEGTALAGRWGFVSGKTREVDVGDEAERARRVRG